MGWTLAAPSTTVALLAPAFALDVLGRFNLAAGSSGSVRRLAMGGIKDKLRSLELGASLPDTRLSIPVPSMRRSKLCITGLAYGF